MEKAKNYKRKYSFKNEDYFNVIDSEDKAYFLGLLWTDGCNDINNDRVVIALREDDAIDVLPVLNTLIYNEDAIKYRKSNTTKYHGKLIESQPQLKLAIYSRKMCESLYKIGMFLKTDRQLPDIEKKYLKHFLRGVFDGDGSINHYKEKNRHSIKPRFYLCSSYGIIEGVSKILACMDINHQISDHIGYKIIYCGGANQVIKFLDYIYSDATIYLKRKHSRYIEIKKDKEETVKRTLADKWSKYEQVTFNPRTKRWWAFFKNPNKKRNNKETIGWYDSEKEAHQAVINFNNNK